MSDKSSGHFSKQTPEFALSHGEQDPATPLERIAHDKSQPSQLAVVLEMAVLEQNLGLFRDSTYKMIKFRGTREEAIWIFKGIQMDKRTLAAKVNLFFTGDWNHLGGQIRSRLGSLANNKEVVRLVIDGVEHAATKRGFKLTTTFYISFQNGNATSNVQKESNLQLSETKGNAGVEETLQKTLEELKLVENVGVTGFTLVSVSSRLNSDIFLLYRITIPLTSTEKAARIIEKTWCNGGSFVVARPNSGEAKFIQVPVSRAWISNPDFSSLEKSNSKISKIMQYISQLILEESHAMQLIGEYWSCDARGP